MDFDKVEEDIKDILNPYHIKNRGKNYRESAKEIREYLENSVE